MGAFTWITDNWFLFLQSVGIIGGLLFAGSSLRLDAKSRRISNLMTITKDHREIWSELYDRPELARAVEPNANLTQKPLTTADDLFIRSLILHLNVVYHASKDDVLLPFEGLERDIQGFFSLPLPKAVWERLKPFQDSDFVQFVEKYLKK